MGFLALIILFLTVKWASFLLFQALFGAPPTAQQTAARQAYWARQRAQLRLDMWGTRPEWAAMGKTVAVLIGLPGLVAVAISWLQ